MKKVVFGIAAMALVSPSVVSAKPAAQALSIKSAAVQPVRAAAKKGKANALPVEIVVAGVLLTAGAIALSSSSDSN